jgi:acetyl esterase/lipase
MNVAYGNDPLQKMDIYLPAGRTDTTKVMIMIHGGGWTIGDKSEFDVYIPTVKQRLPGYAIVNMNYRLNSGTTNQFPAQENDVKAALTFIYNKRGEYKISDKFVLLGASAGGHLALLQAYKYTTPVKAKAVVSFFGPTDMAALYNAQVLFQNALQSLLGGTPASNPSLYQQSSPIFFAGNQSPPTLLLHGGVDPIVPAAQSEALKNKLQTAGVAHQYVFYPSEGHGFTAATMDDAINKVAAFLRANVQ